jgi:ubiquitin-like 1-activating enzyme E1 A
MASLTEREAAVYDRQIRLWGIEAQKRLQSSEILICGANALGLEVAKNLTLAGFNVSIQDSRIVVEEDLGANYFLSITDVGRNRAQAVVPNLAELNPLVEITAVESCLSQIDESILVKFNCVLLINIPIKEAIRVNNICHQQDVKFFYGNTYGSVGTFFADLGTYTYTLKKQKNSTTNEGSITQVVTKTFSTLENSVATPWPNLLNVRFGFPELYFATQILEKYWGTLQKHPRYDSNSVPASLDGMFKIAKEMSKSNGGNKEYSFVRETTLKLLAETSFSELSPVCAVLGGLIGQEIIKVIAGKGQPICNSNGGNWLFFDPMSIVDPKGGAIVKSNPPE